MNEESTLNYKEKLRRHYVPLVAKYGDSFQSVDWGSIQGQQKRFRVLLEAMDFNNARILDVGCGVGHLVDYLKEHNYDGHYLGIDLVREMTETAARRHPAWDFRFETNINNAEDFSPDIVVASGLFTFADEDMLKDVVQKLFAVTRNAVAFNSLSLWGGGMEPNEYNADPVRVLEFCRSLTERVVLRHDYLPHDFTIYLYKNDSV